MYAVRDIQSHMSLVGDWGGEEDLCHVRSGGRLVRHVPSGRWGRRGDLCHVCSRGCSVTHVPSGGWGTCPQWRMGEKRMISAMYAVGDPQ